MKLIPNWKRVALRAYSMWFGGYLTLAWLILPEILYSRWGIELSPALVWLVAFVLVTLAMVLRLKDQGIGK